MATFWQDLRYGARSLARTPAFTAVAVLTLALGIGANAAIFSVTRAVLLAPLPYADPGRTVAVWSRWTGWDKTWVSEAELLDYRRTKSLRNVGAWRTTQANLTGANLEPERVGAAQVTPTVFTALGARSLLGRPFTPDEEVQGRDTVVVLGHALWQRRFGGDPAVLHRRIRVDGRELTVVGIMPKGFQLPTDYGEDFAEPTELWTPLTINPSSPERGNHGFYAVARLAPGATLAQANEELRAITRARTREGAYPEAMRFEAFAVSLDDEILGAVRPRLVLLAVAVGFLLLIACANVASLLLARAEGRVREVAVRRALGAGNGRLVRQALTESLLLSMAGAACGLAFALEGVKVLASAAPGSIPRLGAAGIDAAVLLFALVAAVVTTGFFSVAPIARLVRLDPVQSLKEGGQSTPGSTRQRFRQTLIVAEMALAVLLLVCAGLMVRSLWAMERVPLGFDPRGVLTVRLALPAESYPASERIVSFYERLTADVRALPGVTAAGAIRSLPLGATIGDWGLDVEGYVETPGRNAKGDWQVVTPGALEALGERVIAGRGFTESDRADAPQVALVNETMARRYWSDGEPIGHRIRMGSDGIRPWVTVVGVVQDVRHNGITTTVKEKFYRPHAQFQASTGFAPSGDDAGREDCRRSAHARKSGAARRGATRSQSAGVGRATDERGGGRHDGAIELHRAPAGALRHARRGARSRRHLRAALVPREPAHAGIRDQDGDWGEPARRARARRQEGPPADRRRRCRGAGAGARDHAVDAGAAVWRRACRYRDVCGGAGDPGCRCAPGQLLAGRARHTRQSAAGAQIRLTDLARPRAHEPEAEEHHAGRLRNGLDIRSVQLERHVTTRVDCGESQRSPGSQAGLKACPT